MLVGGHGCVPAVFDKDAEDETIESNNNNKRKILIVDDHPVMRCGLKELIDQQNDLVVCAEAENANQALEAVGKQHIDLGIVDISMEGTTGIQLTEKLKLQHPSLPILILSMHDDPVYTTRSMRAGARGYVVKQDAAEEIITAIYNVLEGRTHISERMLKKMKSIGVLDANYGCNSA